MCNETVYVFYPDRGYTDDDAELEKVSGLLDKFHIDHKESQFWMDCIDKWRKWHARDEDWKRKRFDKYLLNEEFMPCKHEDFAGEKYRDGRITKHEAKSVAGFFLRNDQDGSVQSVWQCLNPNGFIDRVETEPGWNRQPLLTKSGEWVQSCLVAQLDLEGTSLPDAFVFRNTWRARNRIDPVTGAPTFSPVHEWGHDWASSFQFHVNSFSPNTRVTSVQIHY